MIEVMSNPDIRAHVMGARSRGATVGLVPTMGFLHDGHLQLVDAARSENDVVILSIFVNPTQFGPREDFERYPRDLSRDRTLAEQRGVDLLFTPSNEGVYPRGPLEQKVWIDPGEPATYLCGASRPGHFRGVTTAVAKLLNITSPDRVYFGQKDGQQAVLLSLMVEDLACPVSVRVMPTVREEDGLALSSRNVYLSPAERAQASAISRALLQAQSAIVAGERSAHGLETALRCSLQEMAPDASIDYCSVADLATLRPVRGTITGDVLVAVAVYFGSTRLIDNCIVRFKAGALEFS